MGNLIEWLKAGGRWKLLFGGFIIGLGANDFYCALYTGIGVGGAIELKEKLRGGLWDWMDFLLMAGGAFLGHSLRWMVSLVW